MSSQRDTTRSAGAFTMLQEGMAVEFVYRRFDEKSREITSISELADNVELEEY